MKTTICHFSSN